MTASENVVLATLRGIDERIDRLSLDVQDIKGRMGAVGSGLEGINRRLDRLDGRFERIEKHLELSSAPH